MSRHTSQAGEHLEHIRKYIELDVKEDYILYMVNDAFETARKKNLAVDVSYKFSDGQTLTGIAEKKKLNQVHALFLEKGTGTTKPDTKGSPILKKRQKTSDDGKKSNVTKTAHFAAISTSSSKQNENTGLKSFLHGIAYQLKLILIIFDHAYQLKKTKRNFECTVSTEDAEAGKFDDIVYKYKYPGEINTVYIQAKHKKNPYKIGKTDLTTSSNDSPYALVPYFSSFLDLKLLDNSNTKDLFLTTNARLHESLLPMVENVNRSTAAAIDTFFEPISDPESGQQTKCYRLSWQKIKSDKDFVPLIEKLKGCSDSNRLAKLLAEYIYGKKKLTQKTALFKANGAAIIFDIVGKEKNKKLDQYYINDNFLTPNVQTRQHVKYFRDIFEAEYKKLTNVDVWQDVALKGISITSGFMKDLSKTSNPPNLPNDKVTDSMLEEFFNVFALVCNTVNEEVLTKKVVERWENSIVSQLCNNQLSPIASENARAVMTEYVFDWISRNGQKKNENDIEIFYEQLFYKIQLLQLQGVTDNRLQELKQLNIEVERHILQERCFYQHLWPKTKSDDLLIYRSHFDTSIVAAIVLQTLTIPPEKKDEYDYIFLDDRTYQHMKPALEGIFRYIPVNIALIVEFKNETTIESLVEGSKKLLGDTREGFLKKTIFIERIDIEQQSTNGEIFLIRHLTKGSRESFYEQHKNTHFFGANVKLEDIVENDDDLMYLFELTKKQSLSSNIIEQKYSKIQTWYIERTIETGLIDYAKEKKRARYRTRAEMKKFSSGSGSLGLSTFCKELTSQLEISNSLSMKRFDYGKIINNLRQLAIRGTKPQCDPTKKMHIIVDEPGIGKTTYLTWLAKELQTENSSNWIIPFTSIECATDLARMCQNMGHLNQTVALRFLFELLFLAWYVPKINRQTIEETDPVREKAKRCASLLDFENQHVLINEEEARRLGTQQLAHLRIFKKKYNDSKMIILFDGFDEIAPHYKEIVLALFSHYNNMSGIDRIYLSSRPNMFEKEFEDHFNEPKFYHLQPFTERDQIVFLDTFLRRKLTEYATLQGRQEGYELLCILHNVTDELLGDQKKIPLFMSVSSELLLPLVQTHISFAPEIIVSTNLIEEAKVIFEPQNMIEKFIDRKLYILNVEKTGTTDAAYNIPATQLNAEELNAVKYRKHILLALYAICGQDELNGLLEQNEQTEALQYMVQVQLGKEKSGIVEAFNNNVPQFIHRTIPEFLMARWIFNNRNEEKVRAYLLSNQYWIAGKRVVRDYLNRMLAYGSPIHQAVINQHTLEVNAIIKRDPEAASTLDAGGRTPLHLASEFGNLLQHRHTIFRELFEKLLESSPETVDTKDNLFYWRPIDYALRSNSFQAIEMLREHGVTIDPDVLTNQIVHCSTDLYEILNRAALYENELYTNNGRYQEKVVQTCRQVANILLARESLNLYAPIGEENMTPIELCTNRDAPELLKSLLFCSYNPVEFALKQSKVGILEFIVTSKHDFPTDCRVTDRDLELCIERGYTKLFGILFQKYCKQENLPYDSDDRHEKEDTGEGLKHLYFYNGESYHKYGASEYKTKTLDLLSVAVKNGNFDVVRCMIEKAKLFINNDTIKYLVHHVARFYRVTHARVVPIFRYLLEATEDILAVDNKGRTLLHYFARVGYLYMVKYLIEQKGFSPQTVNDRNGWNAFHYCVSERELPNFCTIFHYMMKKGRAEDIHAIGFDGNNVLYVAVENRHFGEGKLIVASVLENVTAPNDQCVLKEYFEASDLTNNEHFGDFLDYLIDNEQGDLIDVFRSVKEEIII